MVNNQLESGTSTPIEANKAFSKGVFMPEMMEVRSKKSGLDERRATSKAMESWGAVESATNVSAS